MKKIELKTPANEIEKELSKDRFLRKTNNANNEVYLLDYKTGEKNQKHQNQINEYAFVLQEMNYTIAKKALVYIGEKIEVVLL